MYGASTGGMYLDSTWQHLIYEPHDHEWGLARTLFYRDQSGPPQLTEGASLAVAADAQLSHRGGAEGHLPTPAGSIQQIERYAVGASIGASFCQPHPPEFWEFREFHAVRLRCCCGLSSAAAKLQTRVHICWPRGSAYRSGQHTTFTSVASSKPASTHLE